MSIFHSIRKSKLPRAGIFGILLLALLAGQSCTFSLLDIPGFSPPEGSGTPSPNISTPTATPLPSAKVTFTVHLPSPVPEGEILTISILDEVTGLGINDVLYPMEKVDSQTYKVSLLLPIHSLIKYRYALKGNIKIKEMTTADEIVRYRMYYVNGEASLEDVVSGWEGDSAFGWQTGKIEGVIRSAVDGAPLPDILVEAGGVQAFTDSSGRFSLEGIPPGIHTLVAYALDGAYQIFQQGAQVQSGLVTPVEISLAPAPKMTTITFLVTVPKNTVTGAPVRIAGNLLQFGNTYSDLQGGLSLIADRMPTMTLIGERQYKYSIQLPAGTELRYKYTLGDGFWNAEHDADGGYRVRRLIVPETDTIIQDTVETWQAGSSAPILFEVSVPDDTPAGDVVYIQFHPYIWTEPIPMWAMGNNRWTYKLYGPFNMLGHFGYRYCRNAQCGSADDVATTGKNSSGRPISTSLTPQDIQDTVTAWKWLDSTEPATIVAVAVQSHEPDFVAGVELLPNASPNWVAFTSQAMQNVQGLGANWVVLTPTWTFSRISPLVFAERPGDDPFWEDSAKMISQARALNLNVALFPQPNFPEDMTTWWQNAPRDGIWWDAWFEQYRQFVIHHADMATKDNAQALILGGDWISPALPGGTVNGQPSGLPSDAAARWEIILNDARTHFGGKIWWALPYTPGGLENLPTIIGETDGVYLLWDAPLSESIYPAKEDLMAEAARLLDEEVAPFHDSLGKPVILAMAVPSVSGAATDCLPAKEDTCLDWRMLSPPNDDFSAIERNLQSQSDIYEAMLNALNERAWVGGIVSRGYYPPVMLQDKSASVRGKPAADLLWYWFPRLLGIQR